MFPCHQACARTCPVLRLKSPADDQTQELKSPAGGSKPQCRRSAAAALQCMNYMHVRCSAAAAVQCMNYMHVRRSAAAAGAKPRCTAASSVTPRCTAAVHDTSFTPCAAPPASCPGSLVAPATCVFMCRHAFTDAHRYAALSAWLSWRCDADTLHACMSAHSLPAHSTLLPCMRSCSPPSAPTLCMHSALILLCTAGLCMQCACTHGMMCRRGAPCECVQLHTDACMQLHRCMHAQAHCGGATKRVAKWPYPELQEEATLCTVQSAPGAFQCLEPIRAF
jgi:hypothetical protein